MEENWKIDHEEWMLEGLCRSSHNKDLWHSNLFDDVRKAIAICNSCPVIKQCQEYSIKHRMPYGIWGGMVANKRNQIIKERIENGTLNKEESRPPNSHIPLNTGPKLKYYYPKARTK